MPYDDTKLTAIRRTTPDQTAMNCGWCAAFEGRSTPSQRRAGKGLSPYLCRHHADHLARHGHAVKPSWTATEYRPFSAIASAFIRKALSEPRKGAGGGSSPGSNWPSAQQKAAVKAAVDSYAGLLLRAPPPSPDLPRQPKERARALLGRMKARYERRGKTARETAINLLGVVVGLQLANVFDPNPARDGTFMLVQIGKRAHCMAGGWHRDWPLMDRDGKTTAVWETHKFPHSRGRVLIELGRMLVERSLVFERAETALRQIALETIPANPVRDWQKTKRMTPKGGKRRKPYRPPLERGASRVRLKGPH